MRKALTILLIITSNLLFSQFTNADYNEINNIRYGLYDTCLNQWLAPATRINTQNAFEDLTIYNRNHPDNKCMRVKADGFGRIDVSNKWYSKDNTLNKYEKDTILSVWLFTQAKDSTFYTGILPDGKPYLIKTDSITVPVDYIQGDFWKMKLRFFIDNYGLNKYVTEVKELKTVVFQEVGKGVIENITSSSFKYRVYSTKQSRVKKLYISKFNEPFNEYETDTVGYNASKKSENRFTHGRTFLNLEPDTTYKVREIQESITGEIFTSKVIFTKTLP